MHVTPPRLFSTTPQCDRRLTRVTMRAGASQAHAPGRGVDATGAYCGDAGRLAGDVKKTRGRQTLCDTANGSKVWVWRVSSRVERLVDLIGAFQTTGGWTRAFLQPSK